MQPDGFILGLTSGAACIATCAPVLIPYLLGEGAGILRNVLLTGEFLLGRLLGYLMFAVLAWGVGRSLLAGGGRRDIVIGAAFVLFSGMLIWYGFFRREASGKTGCPLSRRQKILFRVWPSVLPVAAGLATGLSFCPPFLLAFTGAAAEPTLARCLLYFFSFFLGTSVLFVLAPLVGAAKRFSVLQTIGRLAAGIMGIYYLYSGVILLIGGYGRG
jgi:hypothetical protein